jgi:hypothetical protein
MLVISGASNDSGDEGWGVMTMTRANLPKKMHLYRLDK